MIKYDTLILKDLQSLDRVVESLSRSDRETEVCSDDWTSRNEDVEIDVKNLQFFVWPKIVHETEERVRSIDLFVLSTHVRHYHWSDTKCAGSTTQLRDVATSILEGTQSTRETITSVLRKLHEQKLRVSQRNFAFNVSILCRKQWSKESWTRQSWHLRRALPLHLS